MKKIEITALDIVRRYEKLKAEFDLSYLKWLHDSKYYKEMKLACERFGEFKETKYLHIRKSKRRSK